MDDRVVDGVEFFKLLILIIMFWVVKFVVGLSECPVLLLMQLILKKSKFCWVDVDHY